MTPPQVRELTLTEYDEMVAEMTEIQRAQAKALRKHG